MKKRSERRKHCALAVVMRSQKCSPRLPGGAGRPKFNQFGEDRCTQFWVIVVTDPQAHTHTPPARCKHTDRTDHNTLCSYMASPSSMGHWGTYSSSTVYCKVCNVIIFYYSPRVHRWARGRECFESITRLDGAIFYEWELADNCNSGRARTTEH